MLNDIYNTRILTFAGNIPRIGHLDAPDGDAVAVSKMCGSQVSVEVQLDGDVIVDFAHQVKACALGQASSSILATHIVGSSVGEIQALRDQMRAMLKQDGPVPTGKWQDLEILEPVRDYRARHASTLLTFEATCEAIEKAITARTGAFSGVSGGSADETATITGSGA